MPKGLTVTEGTPSRPYLVFTSAGDQGNVLPWLEGRRNFDLWVTYYGHQGHLYRDVASFYNRRRGSKFQNLLFAFQTWPHLFAHYEAILVMDDDIRIGGREISRLFELRAELDLWLLQPAFRPRGKISHPITRLDHSTRWRYTNFVEVTCPLFRRDKLDAFLKVYDPVLVGFGIDWWFMEVLGEDLEGKVAIIDEISCVNPPDWVKEGQREIDRLQPLSQRIAIWKEIRSKYGIRSEAKGAIEYRRVRRGPVGRVRGYFAARVEKAVFRIRLSAVR
jgi:hypothetical protein